MTAPPAATAPRRMPGAAQGAILAVLIFVVAALLQAVHWYQGASFGGRFSLPRELAVLLLAGAILLGTLPSAGLGACAGAVAQWRRNALAGALAGLLPGALLAAACWVFLLLNAAQDPIGPSLKVLGWLCAPAALAGLVVGWRAAGADVALMQATRTWIARGDEAVGRVAADLRESQATQTLTARGAAAAGRLAQDLRESQAAHLVGAAGRRRGATLLLVGVILALFSFAVQLAVPEFHVAGDDGSLLPTLLRSAAQPWLWCAGLVLPAAHSQAAFEVWAATGAFGLGLNGALVGALLAALADSPAAGPSRRA